MKYGEVRNKYGKVQTLYFDQYCMYVCANFMYMIYGPLVGVTLPNVHSSVALNSALFIALVG